MTQANVYFGHGTDNAWDEAVQMVMFALELPYNSGADVLTRELTHHERDRVLDCLKQRIEQRKPLPYITHQAWFMQLPFYVDERVLIPRSPFAEWIERRFSPWLPSKPIRHILEIGTGSGCMAIAAALMFEDAKVIAADISPDALEVAKRNVAHYKLEQRVTLCESDCFSNVPKRPYDLIISNPPYVGAAEMTTLPKEYQHEPGELALEAPDNGLAIVDRILQQAADYMADDGLLVVEVGNSDEAVAKRYQNLPFIWLEQARGGHGLFLLSASDLKQLS